MPDLLRELLAPIIRRMGGVSDSPMNPDEVRDWFMSLDPTERAAWSVQIRGSMVKDVRRRREKRHVASGALRIQGARGEADHPAHNFHVELWDRDPFGQAQFLGRAVTDREGRYEIEYNPLDAGEGDAPDLELRVVEARHLWHIDGNAYDEYLAIHREVGPDDYLAESYQFHDISIPWWGYDSSTPIPRLATSRHGTTLDMFSRWRALAVARAIDPIELVNKKHLAMISMGLPPTLDAIQADYPDSGTLREERREPGVTRGGRWFGDRLLNGFYSSVVDRDWAPPAGVDPARAFRVYYPWNSYAHDAVHALPDVDVRLQLEGDALTAKSVRLGFRTPGVTEKVPASKLHWITVDDTHPKWRAALRFARVSATYDAELTNHLARCHLNMEQYAIAARRNVRANPVRWLLFPHLREVASINREAGEYLLGANGYVVTAGGLSPDGVNERLVQAMGTFDWKGFAPQEPVSPQHRLAVASAIVWNDILGAHVDKFFEENEEEIRAHWYELHRMSVDLVEHSVPFFACGFVRDHVRSDGALFMQRSERNGWDARLADETRARGRQRSVSHFAPTEDFRPDSSDWDDVKAMCRYVIFFATFRHAWTNNLQWDDVGEIRYASLGLRWHPDAVESAKQGRFDPWLCLADEGDDRISPDPRESTDLLYYSWFLSRSNYGSILTNEDHDIHPRLVSLVRQYQARLAELGFDATRMSARVNI